MDHRFSYFLLFCLRSDFLLHATLSTVSEADVAGVAHVIHASPVAIESETLPKLRKTLTVSCSSRDVPAMPKV